VTSGPTTEELKLERLQTGEDFRAVMSLPAGRRLMASILYRLCNLDGFSDGPRTEGRRDVAQLLLADLKSAAPEMYALMESERISSWLLKARQAQRGES
jgi:hypothetical protein